MDSNHAVQQELITDKEVPGLIKLMKENGRGRTKGKEGNNERFYQGLPLPVTFLALSVEMNKSKFYEKSFCNQLEQ